VQRAASLFSAENRVVLWYEPVDQAAGETA